MSKDLFTILIIKRFRGEISREEDKQLADWLNEDSSHMDLYNDLEKSWNHAGEYKSDFKADLDKGWQQVSAKIRPEDRVRRIVPVWNRPVFRIAASMVILIGLAWASYWFLDKGSNEVAMVTVSSSEGEVREVNLPDGSSVWLNENSELKYPADFKARNVMLSGEAEFSVTHDEEHPFRVNTDGAVTRVLGTRFNVSAYPSSRSVEVSLMEGKVSFKGPEKDEVILEPGEFATWDRESNSVTTAVSPTSNANAWHTGTLTFNGSSLEDVAADLEDYFDTNIDIFLPDSSSCTFTGTFRDPDLQKIIEVLAFTFDLNHTERDGNYHIIINKCD